MTRGMKERSELRKQKDEKSKILMITVIAYFLFFSIVIFKSSLFITNGSCLTIFKFPIAKNSDFAENVTMFIAKNIIIINITLKDFFNFLLFKKNISQLL